MRLFHENLLQKNSDLFVKFLIIFRILNHTFHNRLQLLIHIIFKKWEFPIIIGINSESKGPNIARLAFKAGLKHALGCLKLQRAVTTLKGIVHQHFSTSAKVRQFGTFLYDEHILRFYIEMHKMIIVKVLDAFLQSYLWPDLRHRTF